MKVLVTGKLPDEVVSMIRKEHVVLANEVMRPMPREEIIEKMTGVDGLLSMVTDRIDEELMDRAPNLRMIANYGVGYDNIDVGAATARGIWVSNTPGVLTDATADLTFTLILAIARRVVQGDRRTRSGEFKFWAPLLFLGSEVSGKTLGIIGLGQIGQAVARRACGFNMPILYHNRRKIDQDAERQLNATYSDLKMLLAGSDFVTLHVNLSEQTRHLIGKEELALMKPTAFFINASRGPVVDERALVEALKAGTIAGAGLDVYENEPALTPGLIDLENVVLSPHLGSATLETRTAMALLATENLLAGLAGIRPPNCLNDVGR